MTFLDRTGWISPFDRGRVEGGAPVGEDRSVVVCLRAQRWP